MLGFDDKLRIGTCGWHFDVFQGDDQGPLKAGCGNAVPVEDQMRDLLALCLRRGYLFAVFCPERNGRFRRRFERHRHRARLCGRLRGARPGSRLNRALRGAAQIALEQGNDQDQVKQ